MPIRISDDMIDEMFSFLPKPSISSGEEIRRQINKMRVGRYTEACCTPREVKECVGINAFQSGIGKTAVSLDGGRDIVVGFYELFECGCSGVYLGLISKAFRLRDEKRVAYYPCRIHNFCPGRQDYW
ncbi:MAG: hypothetical protein HZB67_03770 [Candidatus Aenigmarchaeota archaeon]|nr:hypothetical protein [Candidatus Aenigmarchaeota archaeon]